MSKPVAVITGAATGIGKATALLLSEKGFKVIGLSRRMQNTDDSYACDIADEASVKKVFSDILKKHGHIDVLVNSAALSSTTKALEVSVKEWDEMFRVNVTGTYLCIQQVLPSMIENKSGKIINLSSIAGRNISKSASVSYTSSKYAIIGLTRQLASQFGEYGININCVAPSQTKTELLMTHVPEERQKQIAQQVPLKRLAEPNEVAEVISFLASKASSYMNGAVLDVNGGQL